MLKILINKRLFLLPDNESWRIHPSIQNNKQIVFTRLASSNSFEPPEFISQEIRDKALILLQDEIMKGKTVIEIITNVVTDIEVISR